jgi:glyoxylase-like metal-dependent hydrolase (beta-lactamase superfamily II)
MSSKGDELKKEYRLSREILPDVYSIKLPLPGRQPGPVNAYLFKGEKNTLVDTGMLHTAHILKEALNEHGLEFSDIDKIIVTHGHPDHCGAAKRIVKAGRAKVVAHPGDKVTMESGRDVSYKRYKKFLQIIGVPTSITILLGLLSFMFKFMAEGCSIDVVVNEGDEIEIGKYRAKIIETPGHSKGSICLFVEQGGILFCGDTIIEHITPNAFIILDEKEELPVRLSQDEFYQSLDKIKKLSPSIIYSAHGKTVTDVDKIVAGYRSAFTERQEKVLSVVRGGEISLYRIARLLFPEIGGVRLPLEIFLSISEVYTTVQVLQREGKVSLNIKNGLLEVTEVIHN